MDQTALAILAVLAAAIAAAGFIIARALARQPSLEESARNRAVIEAEMARLVAAQAALTGRLQTMAETQATAQEALTRTLNERLDIVSHRMGQNLEASTKKTSESLGHLATRLAVIDEAQKNLTDLSTQVVGLQDILANKQARGAFGEIQLNDIVVSALPPSAYSFQTTLSSGARADCLIRLPNPPGPIAIDAKFPLDAYHALRNATDEAGRLAAARQFRGDMTKHIKDISEKYIIPGETAESALMFLPSEAVYAELHANFTEVVTQSYRARVWIVSPTTLMATLNTVRAVLKDAQMREQAGVIQREVGKMLEDVGRLDKRVSNLLKHFGQAEGDLRDIQTSSGRIARRGERIVELEIEESDADQAVSPPHRAPDLLAGE